MFDCDCLYGQLKSLLDVPDDVRLGILRPHIACIMMRSLSYCRLCMPSM